MRDSRASLHARLETRPSTRLQASFRVAKFSRADTPQSTSSTSRVSGGKKSRKRKRTPVHHQPSQMTPTPDRISDIQNALARGGYYKGDPNGKMDPDTVDGLQRFQSANGLDTTGKLDALTLQKLGLGSDIAGVSSPKGIVPHSCCSISPSPSLAPPQSAVPHPSPAASGTSAEPKASGLLDAGAPAARLSDPPPGTSSH
ncbi:MAG: peptidoglycan-binding domain-containing protein [Candidatus Acidiferrales bacterium]